VFVALATLGGGALAVLHIIVAWRKLTTQPAGSEMVTRGELESQLSAIKVDMGRLELYMRNSVHEIRNDLNRMALATEAYKMAISEQIHLSIGAAMRPVSEKLDKHTIVLTRIDTIMNNRKEEQECQ
jgi:hypothetical protein